MEANFLKNHIFPKEASLSVSSLDVVKIEATNANNISISKRKKKRKKWRKKKKFSDKNNKDKHDSYKGKGDMEEVYFYEDKICEFLNLNVKTLKYPATPRYKISHKYTINKKRVIFKRQKKNKRRYFAGELFKQLKSKRVDSLCLMPEIKQKYLFKTAADFNHQLIKDPNNIELWLNFINFQDSTFKFDNLQQKQNSQKFIAEKKLAILDKALEANVMSEILIKERFRIAEYTLTREKIIEDLSDLLKKNPSSYILLSLLVNTTKNNVVHCTVPKVMGIFTQAIDQLHQSRRQLTNECVQIVEQSMLAMLFECTLFLQQAGLWEKLWTLLQLYLKLHVSNPSIFEVNMTIPENQLFDEEDKILQSGLPLSSLWIKIERLRSSIHFLPVEKSEDLQRIVFPNDLTKLLQAFITPSIKFNLVLLVITALKVPLLPIRSSTLEIFNMLQIENIVYNVESVLPLIYSVGPSLDLNYEYLADIANLSVEPQFIRDSFGCSEYLRFVIMIMKNFGDCTSYQESIIIHSWALRFFRFLILLKRKKLSSIPKFIEKESRLYAKELLKQEKYRDCLQFYIEYALLERDLGNQSEAIRILTTMAKLRYSCNILETEGPIYTAIFHNLINTMLQDLQMNRDKIIAAIVSLVEMQPLSLELTSFTNVKSSVIKSQHISRNFHSQAILKSKDKAEIYDYFVPHIFVEWTACHAWLLSLSESIWAGTSYIENIIKNTAGLKNTLGYLWREQLWEILISMLHHYVLCNSCGFTVLKETLLRALQEHPDNLHLLNTLASIETFSSSGSPCYKLVSYFSNDSTLARLVLIFIVRHKLRRSSADNINTDFLSNLFKKSTVNITTKKCPIIWRLFIQFVATQKNTNKQSVKNVFYKAIEECPWVKSLYFEVVDLLPEDLTEIQDLLIEKELRLHTVLEELQV